MKNAHYFMFKAIKDRNHEIVKFFIDGGIDINYQSNEGYTALILASYYGDIVIVKMLVEAGADLYIEDLDYNTAFDIAGTETHYEIQQYLGLAMTNQKSESKCCSKADTCLFRSI